MKGNGGGPRELPAAGGIGLVVPVADHRVGTARSADGRETLVCLELTGTDGVAIRYGLAPKRAVAIAATLLLRVDRPPFAWSRELRELAGRIAGDLSKRARGASR